MPECKIYQPTKNAMQSGRANMGRWILEYEPSERKSADPLMGWIGSGDTATQVRLKFENKEDAITFARKKGLTYRVQEPQRRRVQSKNYSDNFSSRFRFP